MLLPRRVCALVFAATAAVALLFTWRHVLSWAINTEFPRRRKFFLSPARWPLLPGVVFFDSVLRDARASVPGSFSEATLAGPVFIGMVWLLVTTLRARAPRGQWLLAAIEVLVWWGVHWFVAPSVSLPLYIAYRLTMSPSTAAAGQKRDNSKSGDSGSNAATKSNPGAGDDRSVSLERGGGLLPKLALPLVYGMIISAALPPTLTAVGQAVAKHATLSWLPWSYHASHSFVRSWLHDTQKNDMTAMLSLDAAFTMLAISLHTLLAPLTTSRGGAGGGGASSGRVALAALLLPVVCFANYLTAGAPWALALSLQELGWL